MVDWTPFKKEMTYRMYRRYCAANHGTESLCPECRAALDRGIARLEACRFKTEGRPCPNCSDCCFSGDEYDLMVKVVTFDSANGSAITSIRGKEDVYDPSGDNGTRYDNRTFRMKRAMLNLVSENPFSKVTVSSLCTEAGVGRSTFYAHYSSLMDVVDDCIFDFIFALDFMPSQAKYPMWNCEPSGKPMCEFMRSHREYCSLIFDPDLNSHAVELISSCMMPRLTHTLIGKTNIDAVELNVVNTISLTGCLEMIRQNLDKSDEEWAKTKQIIDRYHLGGLKMITYE